VNSRYLVVRFSSLGDVVLTAPVFEAIRNSRPEAHITFLTKAQYADIHRANPFLDDVRAFDPGSESLFSLVGWVRGEGFDRIVDLHRSVRSRLLSLLTGVNTAKYSQERSLRFKLIMRPRFSARKGMRPVVERYLEAAGWQGDAGTDPAAVPRLYLTEKQLEEGSSWRRELIGDKEGRTIAILPGAKHPPKEWPAVYFSELARLLARRGDIPIILPPPGRTELADDIAKQAGIEGVLPSEPRGDAVSLASALSAADAVVANDSGPMHVAAALGVCVVGIFGPTSPELGFAPRGHKAVTVHMDLYCSPCSKHGNHPCWRGKRYCLEEMEPGMVLEALDALLEEVGIQKDLDL